MKKKSINWFKVRILLLSFVLFGGFVLIVGRMFQLQVLKKEQLYRLAAQQHYVQIPLLPKRGIIYDRKGNELAVTLEVDSVYAEPKKVVEMERTTRELAKLLEIDRQELREKLKSRKSFEWIRRKISAEEAERVRALGLPGIHMLKENRRFYPNGQLAAHVIGFVGLDSKGLEGVEFQYDAVLNGNRHVWTVPRDALGRELVMGGEVSKKGQEEYQNIFLTLDKQLQHLVEVELNRAVQKWGAKGGMAIAMEPRTGKILAMASHPGFDPNQFYQYRTRHWRNRAISDNFEPGSLFKTFVAAAALEEKILRPSDSFYCENGSYKVYDRTIHDQTKHGWLTFQQIIKYSSNIGVSKVAEKLGRERLYHYICAFGFGEKTGVGLPGEAKGIVPHPRYWPPVVLSTISFGQGISVTGIQLAAALSAIANGGVLMKPYLVEKITNEKDEVVKVFEPVMVRRVISEETARKVASLLKGATEKGGTGEGAVPTGYEVAGKTGTAQKVEPLLKEYSNDRIMAGFMGFAPVEEPRIVLLVIIDEPGGQNGGGIVAAPVFKAVMEHALPYLHVYPKGSVVVKRPADLGSRQEVSWKEATVDGVTVGRGVEKSVMPDLKGLPMRKALSRIEGKGLVIKFSGNGRVVEQSPKPGTLIERGDICYLRFQPSS